MSDEVDELIINVLKRNARTPYTEIGKEVGLTEGAIRKRVNRLIKSGIIKRFTIEVKSGEVLAITLISVEPSISMDEAMKFILEVPGVEKVYEVTGDFDVVVILSARDVASMNKRIDQLRGAPGVRSTRTMMILREH